MVAGPTRSDSFVREGLDRWLRDAARDLGSAVRQIERPATGWSNETLLVTTDTSRFVVRLPALVAAYPDYDLAAQAHVHRVLTEHGVPAPRVHALEDDGRWLAAPFLVMAWVGGRALGEVPAHDPVLRAASPEMRRAMHEQYVDALASVHRIEDRRLLPQLRCGLSDELAYWSAYLDWSCDGAPPRRLADALRWCAENCREASADVLLWGDPRLGNAMYDDEGALVALLDWELASLGPAEMDLAWYVALGELTASYMGAEPEGLLSSNELLARYAATNGRQPDEFAWHRVFALVRSAAINNCMAQLAHRHGIGYPGVAGDGNPVLDVIWAAIESADRRSM
ncbi:MAG: phosphotransferase family protein [Actinomycetes bacterium]